MGWMLSTWVAVALLVLCRGQNIEHEGKSLSASGYHLCIHNETSIVSFVALHKVPYTVTKPCGGWLLWKTCTVTLYKMTYQSEYKTVMKQVTRCCEGYVQVGRYCALPVNRTGEFTAKPGSCPNADGLYPRSEVCDWDIDCPGWQKCCQRSGCFVCSDPASSANYSENGGYRFNVTVTVKTDYHQLTSKERGLLNHTRLLQAMVTGALQSDMSVYYLSSWPVHPYRTATALLVACNFTLSLYNVTSRLHLLLKHIQEVSSVTVKDVDECAHPALRQCSLQAECNNTVGSYRCACRGGYVDVDPGNPGAHCTADITAWTPLPCFPPTMNMNYTPASTTTQDPPGSSTVGPFNSTDINMTTTALSNTSSVPYNSSHAPHWTSSAPYTSMSSTVESPLPTTACSPPNISSLESANITGTSFCITWSSQFQTNQTYRVVLSNRSEVNVWETGDTMMEMRGLLPGELYNVTVTPHSCGSQGHTLHILVRTDAQTLDATARITQIQFTADLQTTSSQAYKNLSASIVAEIYRSLSPEMKDMVDSSQVRIEIRGFSPGSVVVTFRIIFPPDQSQDIKNVSNALLNSLMNSSKYTVDENNTSINDFDECASGENDCSQWAKCTNIWASYTCNCMDGFKDNNSQRPGRACQGNASQSATASTPTKTTTTTTTTTTSTTTTTPAIPTMTFSPTTTITNPTTTAMAKTNATALRTVINAYTGAISVQCRIAAITVTVAKDFLMSSSIRESALYLGKEECGINNSNATHAQLTVAWDECDTTLVHNDTYYTASVTLINNMDPYILPNGTVEVPRIRLEVPIMCTYMRSMLMSADFGSMGYAMIKDVITGSGSFQVTVQLMNGTVPLPHNYSLSPDEALVLEVSLNTSSPQIKVVINMCWATPTPNPADTNRDIFLNNRCSLNTYTQVLMNGNSSTSRVSVQIFSIVKLNMIYLHCQVQVCVQIGSATCVPDCVQRTSRFSNTIGTAVGSTGPILRSENESFDEELNSLQLVGLSCLGVGLSLFFIIGFVCLFYYQRNRIGHYNFSVKPKEENFTYLVFNT
ncbi:uromodulin-like 1 [Scomber scombrus]|uniref:uromodulin-like 1 n=1 Tax=Scomber scombrus TaxID=13677 RepID=UPI002DDC5D4C|nr:uromodulin-like 1 [Scomber scombrus]